MSKGVVIGVILFLFVAIRLINLPLGMGFGSDEGRDFLTVWEMYTEMKPKLIGPPSEYSINGQQFYFGPAPYYLILPALLIGNWNPIFVSYFIIGLNAIVLVIALRMISQRVDQIVTLYSFAIFCAFHPAVITYTRSYWNPHFTFFVSLLLLALLVNKAGVKAHPVWYFLGIGFLFGLGMQFHYAFIFAILVSMTWLFVDKKIHAHSLILLMGGFVVGVLPLLLYELFTNFYNVRIVLQVFGTIQNSHTPFRLHAFYLISLLPFLFYLLSLAMAPLHRVSALAFYIVFGLGIGWSFLTVLRPPISVVNYSVLQEMTEIIRSDQPKGNFNVVDQLTRDNRAMALRYLVTVTGNIPLGVEQYPQSDVLYMYTKSPLQALLTDPVYELMSDRPLLVEKEWQIQNGIKLYKLKKPGM